MAGVKMDEIKKCLGIFKLDGERVDEKKKMKDSKSPLITLTGFRENEKKYMSETKLLLAAAGVFLSIPDKPHTFPSQSKPHELTEFYPSRSSSQLEQRGGGIKKRPRLAVKPGASFLFLGEGKRLRFVSFTKTKKKATHFET